MKISQDQKESFEKQGFMIVPGFLNTEELDALRGICDQNIVEVERKMRLKGVVEDRINVLGKKYFILDARKNYKELVRLIFSEKMAEVCRSTIGDTAYLHNEQFVVKMTDANTSFAWHQDSGYSVFQGGAAPHKAYVTCWIALDDMSSENGTISVLPFDRAPSKELIEHHWEAKANAMVGYQGDDPGILIKVKAGTLVAFSSLLLHKSGANTTSRPRRSYFVAFTPELFTYADVSKGVYSSGEQLI